MFDSDSSDDDNYSRRSLSSSFDMSEFRRIFSQIHSSPLYKSVQIPAKNVVKRNNLSSSVVKTANTRKAGSAKAECIKMIRNDNIITDILDSLLENIDTELKDVIKNGTVYNLKVLSPLDMEYRIEKDSFESSMTKGTKAIFRTYSVQGVTKILCPYLLAQFHIKELKKDQSGIVFTEEVYHGTKKANIPNICRDNFDWRKSGQHVGSKFGKGVSFAKYHTYATFYPKISESPRAMIVTNILYVNKQQGNLLMTIPSEGYDTSINPKGEVIVKYDDAEFLPQYVVYYR